MQVHIIISDIVWHKFGCIEVLTALQQADMPVVITYLGTWQDCKVVPAGGLEKSCQALLKHSSKPGPACLGNFL